MSYLRGQFGHSAHPPAFNTQILLLDNRYSKTTAFNSVPCSLEMKEHILIQCSEKHFFIPPVTSSGGKLEFHFFHQAFLMLPSLNSQVLSLRKPLMPPECHHSVSFPTKGLQKESLNYSDRRKLRNHSDIHYWSFEIKKTKA